MGITELGGFFVLSQFLIGKVELYQENFPQRAEKEKFKSQFLIGKGERIAVKSVYGKPSKATGAESQFLIGKVEQEAGLSPKGEFYMWVLKSQFLLGKV